MKVYVTCFADVRQPGGGATLSRRIATGLERRGCDVLMISKTDAAAERDESRPQVDGLPVVFHQVSAGRFWRAPALVQEEQIMAFLRTLPEPDGLVAASPFYVTAARRLWPRTRIVYAFPCLLWRCLPRTHAGRRGLWFMLNRYLIGRCERRAVAGSDVVLAQSPSVVEDIEDFCGRDPGGRGRLTIVPTGVDDLLKQVRRPRDEVRRELSVPEESVVLLSVAHQDANKNVSAIIAALAAVMNESPAAPGAAALPTPRDLGRLRLWLCGDGPQRQQLRDLVARHGLGEQVQFLGWRRDLPDLYAAADAFVHAAWYDNFPNVYLEALVCGRPVIGPRGSFPTVVSPLDQIIQSGCQGYAYDLLDPAALPDILRELAARPSRLRAMGRDARRLALDSYTWSRYLDAITEALAK